MIKNLFLLSLLLVFGPTVTYYSDTLKAQKIDSLYKEADFVGYVKILSGEFRDYSGVVYKAKVLTSLKGSHTESIIYVGPYSGYGVGNEYLLFSRKTGQTLASRWYQANHSEELLNYPKDAEYFNIMFEGFGMMPIQYIVDLDGYAVEIASHIKLPQKLKDKIKSSENKKWIGKDEMAKHLESLRNGSELKDK